jgi:hypothetical protein
MATIINATLSLWVYTGEYLVNKPTNPNYVLYKKVKTDSSVITFEIAELIKDFVDVTFTGNYYDIKQTAWAQWTLVQNYDDGTTNTINQEAIASNGYGYFEDGINPLLLKGALLSNSKVYNYSGQPLYIPFLTGGSAAFKVEFYNGASIIATTIFGVSITSITADTTLVTADSTVYTADTSFIGGSSSDDVQYVEAPSAATKFIVTLNNNTTETKYIETIEEGKFTPYKVSFLNKFGVVQDLWFFKRRDENTQIQKEQYLQNTLKESGTNVSYSLNEATKVPNNFKVIKGVKLNTGFIDEEYNEVIQQLLLTERAWIHENSNVFPIIPKTSELQYKTSLNDRLINYTVDFEYAYNEINLIK